MTRIQAEEILIRRLKVIMKAAGLNVTPNGENIDLDDAFGAAFLQMDVAASTPPTTTDVEDLESGDVSEFLLRAQINLLETVLGNIEGTDISMTTGKSETRSQLVDQVLRMLEYLNPKLETLVAVSASGVSYGSLTGGGVVLDFQEDLGAWSE